MPAISTNYTALAALQAFVRTYSPEITRKALIGFDTAKYVMHMPGVKGTHVITDMKKTGSIARGFDGIFSPKANQTLAPVSITTNDMKAEFLYAPHELRTNYLGFLQKTGFDPKDWPLERVFMDSQAEGIAEEMEIAIWEGVRTGVTLDAPIIDRMDGFGVHVLAAIAAGNTAEVTGAVTVTNIVDVLRAMYSRIAKPLKGKKVYAYLSINHRQDYFIKRGETLQHTMDQWTSAQFNTGNMELVFCSGIDDNKIMITPMENLYYAYDSSNDLTKGYFFKEEHYHIEGSKTFSAGTKIYRPDNGWLIVNNQW